MHFRCASFYVCTHSLLLYMRCFVEHFDFKRQPFQPNQMRTTCLHRFGYDIFCQRWLCGLFYPYMGVHVYVLSSVVSSSDNFLLVIRLRWFAYLLRFFNDLSSTTTRYRNFSAFTRQRPSLDHRSSTIVRQQPFLVIGHTPKIGR